MKTFWQQTLRFIHCCMTLFFFYLFFVHPHLDSATPFRDIAHGILTFLLPVALTMTLVIWLTRKLWWHYEAQSLPPMPEKWTETIPAKTMRAIYVGLATIIGSTLLILLIFYYFLLGCTGFIMSFRQPEKVGWIKIQPTSTLNCFQAA